MTTALLPATPNRCVIVMDKELSGGSLANAIAVIALSVGQRHPALVGEPLVDACGFAHPGLIPTGIPMLCAPQDALASIRREALANECDVVDFPVEGQQTKNYGEFQEMVSQVPTENIKYTGLALIGQKKTISKIVKRLDLMS
ncbi:DUF2000 domain-containing protein [Anaeroselena agilis]|uniref:DUF2000 domain-containing protein n=1 Tax=Anaeroselena agilis TaxID=3063788 RepID=A0ABU3P2C1_9FIRM|nr:DUF2000 domain-containing protein [Selenomonadales bacterium 4137-cl]